MNDGLTFCLYTCTAEIQMEHSGGVSDNTQEGPKTSEWHVGPIGLLGDPKSITISQNVQIKKIKYL